MSPHCLGLQLRTARGFSGQSCTFEQGATKSLQVALFNTKECLLLRIPARLNLISVSPEHLAGADHGVPALF
jgi:hypothetical protein